MTSTLEHVDGDHGGVVHDTGVVGLRAESSLKIAIKKCVKNRSQADRRVAGSTVRHLDEAHATHVSSEVEHPLASCGSLCMPFRDQSKTNQFHVIICTPITNGRRRGLGPSRRSSGGRDSGRQRVCAEKTGSRAARASIQFLMSRRSRSLNSEQNSSSLKYSWARRCTSGSQAHGDPDPLLSSSWFGYSVRTS